MVDEFSENEEVTVVEEEPQTVKFDVIYRCLRCGTDVSNTELSRLPELKCICGFRVFTKERPPLIRNIKAN